MKYLATIFLLMLILTTDCLSQSKRRQNEKEIKVDTVDIFSRIDKKLFSERNTFWTDKSEVGIIQSQRFDDSCCVDEEYELNLTIVFDNWSIIELNRDYNLNELRTDCEMKGMFGGQRFNNPTGLIRLTKKEKDRITIHFDITAISEAKDKLLIYNGDRDFRPDY